MIYLLGNVKKFYLQSFYGLNKCCWQSIFFTFIESALSGVIFFLSLYFVNVLHFNILMAGMIMSSYGLGTALGGLVGGKLSDFFSTYNISIISLFIEAVAFFLLANLTSPSWLMLTMFLLGFSAYGFITSNNIGALRKCDEQEGLKLKLIALSNTAANLGIGISAAFIGFLGYKHFNYIFTISSLFLFFLGIRILFIKHDWCSAEARLASKNNSSTHFHNKNSPVVFMTLICLFFVGLIVVQRSTTYSIYLHNTFNTLGTTGIGLLFALNPALIVLFQNPIVNFFQSYNKILIVGIGVLLMGVGMGMLTISSLIFFAILSCVVYTIGEMLFFSVAQLLVYQCSPEGKKGSSFGLFKMIYALSVTVGPSIGGLIYHYFGGHMIWYFSSLIGVACFILCYFFKEKYIT